MPRQYRVRPNPVGSFIGGVVGIAILGFGLAHMPPEIGAFGLLWTVVLIGIIGANFFNAFSDRGVASNIVEVDDAPGGPQSPPAPPTPPPMNVAARLDQLADLRIKNLITAAEYDERRTAILRQL